MSVMNIDDIWGSQAKVVSRKNSAKCFYSLCKTKGKTLQHLT